MLEYVRSILSTKYDLLLHYSRQPHICQTANSATGVTQLALTHRRENVGEENHEWDECNESHE